MPAGAHLWNDPVCAVDNHDDHVVLLMDNHVYVADDHTTLSWLT